MSNAAPPKVAPNARSSDASSATSPARSTPTCPAQPPGQSPFTTPLDKHRSIERFHQTLKKWLRNQPDQPATIADLQALLDQFRDEYNHRRPHSALNRRTPAATYQARPKASPTGTTTPHDRVRHDKIDTTGKVTLRLSGLLHKIAVGRTHARTPVILLVHDLEVRIVNATTGELLRELTINPERTYQPLHP